MKKVSLLLCALFLVSAAAFAQQLTQVDRDKDVQYLQQTSDGVVAATKGLSAAQMKFKPAPDRWSVAETLEHIAVAEDFIFQNVTDKIMKAPLREHVADSPLGQPLDAYEWLLFNGAHSERHTKQILEVKADPNFPKN